jgi:hypothetical protein
VTAWVALLLASVGVGTLAVVEVAEAPGVLLGEDGFFEVGSVVVYAVLSLMCVGCALRVERREGRLAAAWLAWMALLACLRELDAHVVLNPAYLGEWGVRYRMDWWLRDSTPLGLKLSWLAVFVGVAAFTFYPIWRLRREFLAVLRTRPVSTVCIPTGILLLGLGVFIDDPLRNVTVVSKQTKSLLEESAEFCGAALLGVGSIALLFGTSQPDPAGTASGWKSDDEGGGAASGRV